jgi:hypothetical protein
LESERKNRKTIDKPRPALHEARVGKEDNLRTIFVKFYRHEDGRIVRLYGWRSDTQLLPARVIPIAATNGHAIGNTIVNEYVTHGLKPEEVEVVNACVRQANDQFTFHPTKAAAEGTVEPRVVDGYWVAMEGAISFNVLYSCDETSL